MRSRAAVAALLMFTLTSAGLGVPGAVAQAGDGSVSAGAASPTVQDAGSGGAVGAAVKRTPAEELLGSVSFSVGSSTFTGDLEVELTTEVAGAEIRYTTDGRLPTSTSTRYTGDPVEITKTTQLRAQPFVDGAAVGEPGTAVYVASEVTTSHDLPVIVMDDYGAGKPRKADGFKDAAVMVFEPGSRTGTASPSMGPTLASRAGIHVRGQASANYDKPGYRLELWDNQGKDADYPVLGLPADSDWVLRGPFADKTLIRDTLAYSLGYKLGLRAPRYEFCELYLNLDGGALTSKDYMGVYVVTENIKISKKRVNIAEMEETDLTEPAVSGGYVFKFDWNVAEEPMIKCTGSSKTCWRYLEVVEPDPLQPAQQAWLTAYIQEFNDVLHSEDFADPKKGYAAYLDVPSFVDYVIINELSRNTDAYARSAYYHKVRNGKIFAGPLWDYDLAWGNGGFRSNMDIEGWQHEELSTPLAHDWITRLLQDPAFVDQLTERWQDLRGSVMSDDALDAHIDSLAEPLTAAAARNFARWTNLSTRMISGATTPTDPTWRGQIDTMREWINDRAAWLDTQWR